MVKIPSPNSNEAPSRPRILRDVLLFQAKLWLEGFKDVVLMPLSAGAAAIDVAFGSTLLYRVMRLGNQFERWVPLYAALEDDPTDTMADAHLRTLDKLLNKAADGIEDQTSKRGAPGPEASSSSS